MTIAEIHRGPDGGPGFGGRVGRYLWARFGPGDLAATLLFSAAAQAGGAALAQPGPLRVSGAGIAGIAGGVLLALYLRVGDDLKDWKTDRELAATGDARFIGRPQVTGSVDERDLRRLTLAIAALFGLLLAPQPPAPTLLGGLSFLGAWLAARWFFYPAMAGSLPLAFVTHNPLGLLFLSFGAAVGAGTAAPLLPIVPTAALLAGLYLPIAAWEISRKVRTPAEETGYVTWSKVMGWQWAAAVPAVLTVASAALLAFAAVAAGIGSGYPVLVALAALAPIAAAAAFRLSPSPAGARRLRPAVEGYSAIAGLGLVLFVWAARGVVGS